MKANGDLFMALMLHFAGLPLIFHRNLKNQVQNAKNRSSSLGVVVSPLEYVLAPLVVAGELCDVRYDADYPYPEFGVQG